jgi:hypothetical protein
MEILNEVLVRLLRCIFAESASDAKDNRLVEWKRELRSRGLWETRCTLHFIDDGSASLQVLAQCPGDTIVFSFSAACFTPDTRGPDCSDSDDSGDSEADFEDSACALVPRTKDPKELLFSIFHLLPRAQIVRLDRIIVELCCVDRSDCPRWPGEAFSGLLPFYIDTLCFTVFDKESCEIVFQLDINAEPGEFPRAVALGPLRKEYLELFPLEPFEGRDHWDRQLRTFVGVPDSQAEQDGVLEIARAGRECISQDLFKRAKSLEHFWALWCLYFQDRIFVPQSKQRFFLENTCNTLELGKKLQFITNCGVIPFEASVSIPGERNGFIDAFVPRSMAAALCASLNRFTGIVVHCVEVSNDSIVLDPVQGSNVLRKRSDQPRTVKPLSSVATTSSMAKLREIRMWLCNSLRRHFCADNYLEVLVLSPASQSSPEHVFDALVEAIKLVREGETPEQ